MEAFSCGAAMRKTVLTGLIAAAIGAAMIASLGTSNLAFAQERNLAGQEAQQLARCQSDCLGESDTDKGAMGQHSSAEASGGERTQPRNGLANALTEHGDPQHPSAVIGTLCGTSGGGCP
jgi:hypothetical protein